MSKQEPGSDSGHLWHGRFEDGPADAMMEFAESWPVNWGLRFDDIVGSKAHVQGLLRGGLITAAEAEAITAALSRTQKEFENGEFERAESDEDIHTAVERRVTEIAGDAGAKLHTGRSRNDQVATDFRLWCKRELLDVASSIVDLQRTFLNRAESAGQTYLPGYTHLQRAQPILLSHHLAAHAWALSRDLDRMLDTRRRLDVSPLGAGALAGSSLPLDPDFTARELGFSKRFDNSLDAVSDRDFVAEALFDLALLGVHLSRIGEEVVLWSSDEFGFLTLDDSYSTGSSMLPQKKNPDIAELARGKAGRLIGHVTAILSTLKGLPLAYNRDLQEDKEPLFDAVKQVRLGLIATKGLFDTATFNTHRMQAAADSPAAAAVDLAEWLVERNVPFRRAHAIVGQLVRRSLAGEGALADLVRDDPELGHEAAALFEPGTPVLRRTTPGGAGPLPVAKQLQDLRADIEAGAARIAALS